MTYLSEVQNEILKEELLQKKEIRYEILTIVCGAVMVGIFTAMFPFVSAYYTAYQDARLESVRQQVALREQIDGLNLQTDTAKGVEISSDRNFLKRLSQEGLSTALDDRIILAEYYRYLGSTLDERRRWDSFHNYLVAQQTKVQEDAIMAARARAANADNAAELEVAALVSKSAAENRDITELQRDKLRKRANVSIQFAGAILRKDVQSLASKLAGKGWHIPDASRGGERLKSADGLNEIRYFHAEDRNAAELLEEELSAFWRFGNVEIKDFSNSGLSAPIGLLEAWISRP